MNWKELLPQLILDGGPSTCQFAITNICNANCRFCNFSRDKAGQRDNVSVGLDEGLAAIDSLYRNGIRFLIFTGGEPTLNRHLPAFLERCQDLGVETLLVTNASTLSSDMCDKLIEGGLKTAIISVDSTEAAVHEDNRGLDGVIERIRRANQIFNGQGVASMASVTYSRILGELSELPAFLYSLGFKAVTFSFPLNSLDSSYLGCADSELVTYSDEEMHTMIDKVLALKKELSKSQFQVLNTVEALEDMHRHLNGQKEHFVCLGGYKQFYLDWNLMLWRCCNWRRPMCHVNQFDGSQIIRDGCTECMVDCFRDASVLQHVAVSLSDSVHSLCCGRNSRALRQIFNRENLLSSSANAQSSFWLRSL